jgi:hypothetical protein
MQSRDGATRERLFRIAVPAMQPIGWPAMDAGRYIRL